MGKKYFKIFFSIIIVTILLIGVIKVSSVLNTEITDKSSDVSTRAVDLIKITKQGSRISITTNGPLSGLKNTSIGTIFVLFDSDSDNNVWEAGFIYSFISTGQYEFLWTTNLVTSLSDWNSYVGTNYFFVEGNSLIVNFNEFPDILTSSLVVILAEFDSNFKLLQVDWAPDYYNNKINMNDITSLKPIINLKAPSETQFSSMTSTVTTTSLTESTVLTNQTGSTAINTSNTNGISSSTVDFISIYIVIPTFVILLLIRKSFRRRK